MFKKFPPVTKNLLIINCIIFLAQLVFEQRGTDLADYLGLHFALAEDFRVYQLATYMFLHANFTHLFFNMFTLWMFSRIIENVMGPRRFLVYYLACGVGAGLCQEAWQAGEYFLTGMNQFLFVQGQYGLLPMAEYLNLWTTIGASGACYGVLLAFGMKFPNERIILLIPPIPIKAKYFVAGYAVIELLSAFYSNGNIAHFAHLGGMLFGLLLLLYWRRHDGHGRGAGGWEVWEPRHTSRWERLRGRWRNLLRRKPRMTVRNGGKRFKDRDADYEYNLRRRERQEQVDRILDKIKRSGYASLTEEEKRILFDESKK